MAWPDRSSKAKFVIWTQLVQTGRWFAPTPLLPRVHKRCSRGELAYPDLPFTGAREDILRAASMGLDVDETILCASLGNTREDCVLEHVSPVTNLCGMVVQSSALPNCTVVV
jgi:hypothetical protein